MVRIAKRRFPQDEWEWEIVDVDSGIPIEYFTSYDKALSAFVDHYEPVGYQLEGE